MAAGQLCEIRDVQGFAAYVLRNETLEIGVIPELGARIYSLKSLRTGREWMWHPGADLDLFRNRFGDDFAQSTLVGADECLPTIAACRWAGRELPDHGEVWGVPWSLDQEVWKRGVLQTRVDLPVSPLTFERTLELGPGQVRLSYRLVNQSEAAVQYLWALHPLLRVVPGDRLILPQETRELLNGEIWLDALEVEKPHDDCAKVFARPLAKAAAGIANSATGERLEFEWDPRENNTLGIWLTRGGWHGHHHFALEPSNAATDSLALAAAQRSCGRVAPKGTVCWMVGVRVA